MSGHTNGPWSIAKDRAGRAIVGPDGKTVGAAHMSSKPNLIEEVEANARLIAAAPDLYEALLMMVEEKCDYMIINNLGNPEETHTVKVANAALRKVWGKSGELAGPNERVQQ